MLKYLLILLLLTGCYNNQLNLNKNYTAHALAKDCKCLKQKGESE